MAEATITRRQQRAQVTNDQLLAAAREVFEQRGYRATTVGAITEAASTAHGTFYLYFKNKEDAFARVFAQVVGELEQESSVPWQGDTRATIRRAVSGYFNVVGRHRGLWRCLMEGIYQSPSIEAMWLELRRPFVERVQRTLPATGLCGLDRPLDTEAVAVALCSMVEWTAYTVVELGEPEQLGSERAVDAVVDLWHAAVHGA